MRLIETIWISLLGVTAGYTLCLIHFPLGLVDNTDVNNIPKMYSNLAGNQMETLTMDYVSTGSPDGGPAARLSRGSVSSIFEKCIDLGYLLVFTLLASGIVKFLGVVGYKL